MQCTPLRAGALAAGLTTAIAVPVLAAPAGAQTDGARARSAGAPLTAHARDRHFPAGRRLVVHGHVHGGGRHDVTLTFHPHGRRWRAIAHTRTNRHGDYRFARRLYESGHFRVRLGAPRQVVAASEVPTRARHIVVGARFHPHHAHLDVLRGHRARVVGRLKPGRLGRHVRLEVRGGHRWRTVARDRTGRRGAFRLSFRAGRLGSRPARLRFGGDHANGGARRGLGRLAVFHPSVASWYGGSGTTACGGSADRMGVANKYLPCGTMVTIRYRGRTVRVPVIDRGPYVAGRSWDLTAPTARALGFSGVHTVWATR